MISYEYVDRLCLKNTIKQNARAIQELANRPKIEITTFLFSFCRAVVNSPVNLDFPGKQHVTELLIYQESFKMS